MLNTFSLTQIVILIQILQSNINIWHKKFINN